MIQKAEYYISGILNKDVTVLAKAITVIESNNKEHLQLADKIIEGILPYTGKSFRLGITGVPGVGKSTFIESFGLYCINKGHKVAVLAIDPSSNISKGSILGDKTRMEKLSANANAFIRPSPSGGVLGGITSKTYETILLCEAAGFDKILIETVGVGQSEVEVSEISDFFLLLMLAGAGDELQGIKRGIMELADGIAITKTDGNNIAQAKVASAQLSSSLHYFTHALKNWKVPVISCSAMQNTGIKEIYEMMENFLKLSKQYNYIPQKRKEQRVNRLKKIISNYLIDDFYADSKIQKALYEVIGQDDFIPHRIAELLISLYKK